MTELDIPAELLPADGRFGSGPSKIDPAAMQALADTRTTLLGTSHRQAPVRQLVGRVRHQLASLFDLPAGYEVVLGNGGASAFWDVATCCLVEQRAQTCVYGEFTAKCSAAMAAAPFLAAPSVVRADYGSLALPSAEPGIDAYAWAQNETSTGVMAPVTRVADDDSLMLIDATSAAAGLAVDVSQTDAYYFAPQKGLASDGGLWIALLSPAAIDRAERITVTDRWVPTTLDLAVAIESSRKDQTYNTPAIATLFLMAQQLDSLLERGGLSAAAKRCQESAELVYSWAERHSLATPFVSDPAHRSNVVTTIDFDPSVDAAAISRVLRQNGIVDTEPYRKLGRNQLRIAVYPAVDPDDVRQLIACLDYVIERLV